MGGRGSYSWSGSARGQSSRPLSAYAAASLNRGIAGGTSPEAAINRFREQMLSEKVEYSAYVDEAGYVHALGSTGEEGSTGVARLSVVAKEKGISTVVHNHPSGGSDGRKWGGPFSKNDLSYIASAYQQSGGQVNRIIATAREGTYLAKVTKAVTQRQVNAAAKRADALLAGKKFQSERALWKAVNRAYTSEFGKIGIVITFADQKAKRDKLVTQKTGVYPS